MIKIRVSDTSTINCTGCGIPNTVVGEQVYDDEYKVNNYRLLNELGLKFLTPGNENKEYHAMSIINKINKCLSELSSNRSSYSEWEKDIHKTTVFLWGLRITLEEYPNSIVTIFKPF